MHRSSNAKFQEEHPDSFCHILADHINSHAYMIQVCVCLVYVSSLCIVAIWYILSNKANGVALMPLYGTSPVPLQLFSFLPNGVLTAPPNTCIANCVKIASVSSIVTIDSLYELTNALSNSIIADTCFPKI